MSRANSTTTVLTSGRHRWAGVVLTASLAALALAMQWGVVSSQLAQLTRQVNALAREIGSMRNDNTALDRRLSRIEGRLDRQARGDGS